MPRLQVPPLFPPVENGNWRKAVFLALSEPSSSRFSKWFAIFIMLVIVVSCASFVVQSYPSYRIEEEEENNTILAFFLIETACIGIFTVEYLLRLFTVTAMVAGSTPNQDAKPAPSPSLPHNHAVHKTDSGGDVRVANKTVDMMSKRLPGTGAAQGEGGRGAGTGMLPLSRSKVMPVSAVGPISGHVSPRGASSQPPDVPGAHAAADLAEASKPRAGSDGRPGLSVWLGSPRGDAAQYGSSKYVSSHLCPARRVSLPPHACVRLLSSLCVRSGHPVPLAPVGNRCGCSAAAKRTGARSWPLWRCRPLQILLQTGPLRLLRPLPPAP